MAQFDDRQFQWMLAKAQAKMNRRRLLQAAGTAALPLAARVAPGQASVIPALSDPAVAAARRALQEGGNSADIAVEAANALDPKPAELNTVWESGLIAQDPINFSGPLWEELTGIKINVIERPFTELFQAQVNEHLSGTGAFDVLNVPYAWLADFVNLGVLEPLQPYIDEFMNPADLEDYHPRFRELMVYNGQIYGLLTDGDPIILYYRTDLFEDPANQEAFNAEYGYDLAAPQDWQQYDDIQAFFTKLGNGEYWGGASQRSRGQVYGWFMEEFRNRGGRFFDESTMDATLNNEAGVTTLTRMLESNKTMPAGIETWGFIEVLTAWMAGDLAMIGGTWPPIGRWSEGYGADTVQLEFVPASQVADNVGYSVMPMGHSAINGSFLMGVAATSTKKDAAYLFIQWATSPTISLQRCMLPYSLHDPYRLSHYASEEYRALWPNAGEYLDTLKAGADGGLLDLMIPGSVEYNDAIDRAVTAAQAGTPVEEALATAEADFNAITDRIGRDAQKAAYAEFAARQGAYPE